MLRWGLRIVLAAWLLAFAGSAACAAKRVALVIGNGAYTNAPALTNPRNDAEDMAAALKALGFTVILGTDLDKRAMDRKILEFETALSGAEASVFHYSGHGLQVAGVNYLVPVDAELSSPAALRIEAVRLDFVQETMEREAKTNILFLDACRNNPLARNLARSLGTRSADIGRGLAAAESGVGTLVSFSTQPGNVALDGQGRNSPYSGPLAKAIGTPGEDILSILTAVRNEVLTATGQKQVPWENHALTAKFYFNPSASTQAPALAGEAAQAWIAVQGTASEAVLEEYIRRFPDSVYAGFAKARLEELKKARLALNVPISTPAAPKQETGGCSDGLLVSVGLPGEKPCIKPGSGESFKDCPNCPEMVVVPPGSFTMGSPESEPGRAPNEGPQHQVTFARPFAAGKFHVTVDQFTAFVAATGYDVGKSCFVHETGRLGEKQGRSPLNPGFAQAGSHPVVCVSWNDAKAYVAWLAGKTRRGYRLLTEAEWEYAARARKEPGSYPRYFFGNSGADLCRYGNTADQTTRANEPGARNWAAAPCTDGFTNTAPAGSFLPNDFGLYDMIGNAWQWTEDCYNDNYNGAPTNGAAWTFKDCSFHILRGGAWDNNPPDVRSAGRYFVLTGNGITTSGFRVARTLE